jgi:hypothetical protein
LSVFYPHPGTWALWQVGGATTLLIAVSALVLVLRSQRYLLVGWLWYLGTLVPVIGLIQVGDQWMADRYTYVPAIGLFVAFAFGAGEVAARVVGTGRERALWGAVALLGLLCAAATFAQVRYWRDGETLFVRALELAPSSHTAHAVLGVVRSSQDRDEEALAHYRAALRSRPDYALAHYNLGRLWVERDRLDLARPHLEASARLRPEHARSRFYLGLVLERSGDPARAARHYAAGLELEPDDAQARLRLALTLEQLGRPDEARAELRRAADDARARGDVELAREAEARERQLR